VALILNIEVIMNTIIYVRLLNEGTEVFRPVSATRIALDIFKLDNEDSYDSEDEEWEFLPGSQVCVEERMLEGNHVLIATSYSP